MTDLDLNVDTPEKVATILRAAADQYRESTIELQSAWQDKNAGRVWSRIATRIERCAAAVDEITADY